MEEISTNEAKHACRQGWRKEKTYMDDRTSTTTSAKSLLVGVQEWERWSAEVLLRENAGKLQLTARDERRRKILRYEAQKHGLQDKVKPHMEALGAVSTPKEGRGLVDKETKRLEEAYQRALVLQGVPGTRYQRILRHRIFVVSKAMYGWMAQEPGKAWTTRLDEAVLRFKTPQRANKWLRNILEGSMVAMDVVLAQRRAAIVASSYQEGKEPWPWSEDPERGTLQSLLVPFLENTGWKVIGRWCFEHQELWEQHG